MVAEPYALLNADGSVVYALDRAAPGHYLPPYAAPWTQLPVDVALDGSPLYGLYKAVTWNFAPYTRGIPIAQYDLFTSLRQANGTIRFRTERQPDGAMVVCTGKIDLLVAAAINRRRGKAYGVRVEFTRVVEVA